MTLFIGFLIGLAVGILGVLALWLHIADRQEPEAPQGISAVSIIPSGRHGTVIETTIPTNLLKQVFKHLENS
jgi:hypothetical protein